MNATLTDQTSSRWPVLRQLKEWFTLEGTSDVDIQVVDPYAEYADCIPNEASRRALAQSKHGKMNEYDSLEALRERFKTS